jgi:preprotein translocase subunit YajC
MKEQETLIAGLQKGDAVILASGLHGRVYEVHDGTLLLEIADRVRITVEKSSVKRKLVAAPTDAAKGS